MTINPTGEIVTKGSNVTLTCSAQSSPAAVFKWIHNGVERKETEGTLVLANVDESQAGNITCMAFNAKTMRYVSAQVVKFTVIGEFDHCLPCWDLEVYVWVVGNGFEDVRPT